MSKIDLGTTTSSTKFGGSAIDNTPVWVTRIHRSKTKKYNIIYQNLDVSFRVT